MSTGLIVAIVVAALIVLALLVLMPRMRAAGRHKQAERELHSRREAVAGEHRSAAAEREDRAELAERKARMAQQTAERERAEASLQQERAELHERGMADHELVEEHERERFDGVANTPEAADRDGDDDRARAAGDTPAATSPDDGSRDGGRFDRERITDDVRESERSR